MLRRIVYVVLTGHAEGLPRIAEQVQIPHPSRISLVPFLVVV